MHTFIKRPGLHRPASNRVPIRIRLKGPDI
jgi:hypothetical protein